jgi:RNA polymerase sigma factor (sigma-70 family)
MPGFENDVAMRQDLWRALQRLTPNQRAVLVLRHYEHFPDEEIATVLGCSRSNVRSLAARALTRLRSDPLVSPWYQPGNEEQP